MSLSSCLSEFLVTALLCSQACLDLKEIAEKQKSSDNLRRKRKEMKKRITIRLSCIIIHKKNNVLLFISLYTTTISNLQPIFHFP